MFFTWSSLLIEWLPGLDGWMDSWVFERATFQRMLNVASPHTSRDTLLCCIDVVCEWGAFGENKKKDVKEAGECDEMRQKFYLARYTIYMYAYTFIVYIVTWIIFAAEHIMAGANIYYMVERRLFPHAFNDINRYTQPCTRAMHINLENDMMA